MRDSEIAKKGRHHRFCFAAVGTVVLLLMSSGVTQTTTSRQPETDWSQAVKKYPGLPAEFVRLMNKFQHDLELPLPRNQSSLLPLLPDSTTYYAAFPNYGDALHQALLIFRRELQQNEDLRNWWQQGEMARSGPLLEEFIEKLYALSQYVGDEVIVSGQTGGTAPTLLIAAEVRKPGLKDFLTQMLEELPGNAKPALLVLGPQELANMPARPMTLQPVVLVRPDFVVAGISLDAVKSFNNLLERGANQFGLTSFGQRLAQAYRSGVSVLVGADLHSMLEQVPLGSEQNQMMFDRTGFRDAKDFIWEHRSLPGQAASEMELSFTGPRHGVAAWLAPPARLGSLDFISPEALLAGAIVLKNVSEIFDEVRGISTASNPNAFTTLDQMQVAAGINIKSDLLSHLTGEITLELDDVVKNEPKWRAVLGVNGPDRLKQTLSRIFSSLHVEPPQTGEDGVTYYNAAIPSAQNPAQLVYAFVDGYVIVAPTREWAAEGVRLHRGGGSLAKSAKFTTSLPPGRPLEASALLYEDPIAMLTLQMKQSPDLAETLTRLPSPTAPMLVCAYGEEQAIRAVSNSAGADAAAVLVMGAIAVPNLLRARTSANEASAVGTIRTITTAQAAYAATYPKKGYAQDLASLGPDPNGSNSASPQHASLIEPALGNSSCTNNLWCTKSGYRFITTATCKQGMCKEFVAIGSPVTANSGTRNFCATSDGVVRFSLSPPLISPVSVAECRQWTPLQ